MARTGYTGEDGVELISAADEQGDSGTRVDAGATPCGLAARDTLRLEVCYPLHGNDIGPDTNAIEAGLGWVCALDKEFIGSDALRRTRAAAPNGASSPFACSSAPSPGRTARSSTARGARRPRHERDDVAEPRRGHRHGLRVHAALPTRQAIVIDVRGRRHAAEVARKPLYRKES